MTETIGRNAISRRETLRRGAVLGGATLWATPIVQSLTARPAFAQASPVTDGVEGPSYIAMNVTCGKTASVIKLECNGTCGWDPAPGSFPGCNFTPAGTPANGGALGFTFVGPIEPGCVTITVPTGCKVKKSAIKDGHGCCPGPTGTGALVFCRDTC